jgi:putative membrane protein
VNLVSQVFALLAALTHLVVGTLERFFYDRTAVRVSLTTSPADVPEVTLWRSGVAVYNLLLGLGLGLVAGVVALHTGGPTAGRTLILCLCGSLIVSALAFAASFPRLWRGALGQGLPPTLALVAAAVL